MIVFSSRIQIILCYMQSVMHILVMGWTVRILLHYVFLQFYGLEQTSCNLKDFSFLSYEILSKLKKLFTTSNIVTVCKYLLEVKYVKFHSKRCDLKQFGQLVELSQNVGCNRSSQGLLSH